MTRPTRFLVVAAAFFCCFSPSTWALTGGPDAAGYTFIDSNEPGGPLFNLPPLVGGIDVPSAGTGPLLADEDDEMSTAIPIGFTFNYYGNPYTTVFVDSNGHIRFATGSFDRSSDPMPSTNTPNEIIAFHWVDLDASATGTDTIRYQTAGAVGSRTFTVEFLDVGHWLGGTNPMRVQVILFETTDQILMQIEAATSDGSTTTIGIEDATGTIGLQYLRSSTVGTLLTNTAVLFRQAPARVITLAAAPAGPTSANLTWTHSGDHGMLGTAAPGADLRYSLSDITSQADYDNAATTFPVTGEPTGAGGTPAGPFPVTGLPPDTDVYFAIEYENAAGLRSVLSNIATAHTQDLVPPDAVTDLSIVSVVGTLVTVQWTNSGDNGGVGTATTTDIRYRNDGCVALLAADFVGAAVLPVVDPTGEPAPTAANTVQTFTFDVMTPFLQFNVGLVQYDEAGNVSAVSNQTVCGQAGAPIWGSAAPGSDSGGGISNTTANSLTPCMGINPATNEPGVVWTDTDTTGGDLDIFMRERSAGAFNLVPPGGGNPGNVSTNTTPSQFPDIAYDLLGQPVVAWQDVDSANGDADIYVRRFQAGAWANLGTSATGSGISANGTPSVQPSIAINPLTGQPGVAWTDFQLGDFEIFFREFNGVATWNESDGSGTGPGLSDNPGVSQQPSLTYDATGRPIVAWADNSSGNYEIYVRRLSTTVPRTWEELAGSASGGGVSQSPTRVSQNPSVLTDGTLGNDFPVVVWQEHLPDGNIEIYGRRFNGVGWTDFGPASATGGGISVTTGRSTTPELARHPAFPDVFLCVWCDSSDPQGDLEIYGKWFDNGAWRELGTASARLGGISNTSGASVSPCCGITNTLPNPTAYVSWQEFSGGNYEVFVRSLLLFGPVSDSPQEFVVGGGRGAGSQCQVYDNGLTVPKYTPLELRFVNFDGLGPGAGYAAAVGTCHVAAGDVDGDGNDEIAVGMGPFPGGTGGWVSVIGDHSGQFTQLAVRRFPWTAFNAASGEVYPALGDVDGDGRDELLMGMGRFPGGGFIARFDDLAVGMPFRGWIRGGFTSYNAGVGEIHPACGDVDADGLDEIVIGLAQGGAGVIQVRDDQLRGFGLMAQLLYPNSSYNSRNGTVWPGCGNTIGGRGAEILAGPGKGGAGVVAIFGDRAAAFGRLGSLVYPWATYNASVGEVRPAVGNLDADTATEVVAAPGPFPGQTATNRVFVFDDVTNRAGKAGLFVDFIPTLTYNRANGEGFPAVGQLR